MSSGPPMSQDHPASKPGLEPGCMKQGQAMAAVAFCLPESQLQVAHKFFPEPACHGTSNFSCCWHRGHFIIWASGLENRRLPVLLGFLST